MKKRILCEKVPTPSSPVTLSQKEAWHLIKVLRIKSEEVVEVIDKKGHSAWAIVQWDGKQAQLFFSPLPPKKYQQAKPYCLPLELFVACLKANAMETVIKSSVELGVQKITPILTDHGVVKIKNQTPRWQTIADQSLKQCGRSLQMKIEAPTQLYQLFQDSLLFKRMHGFVADELNHPDQQLALAIEKLENSSSLALFIGPEGGWSSKEREFFQKLPIQFFSCGPLILRAETAALYSVAILSSYIQKKDIKNVL